MGGKPRRASNPVGLEGSVHHEGMSATSGSQPARVTLGTWPTPVDAAPRLAARLGMEPTSLWVKRDDLTGLGAGGNKVRKLEYLCAAAVERGATTLVTSGRAQSNHARLTAAAARHLGMDCTLVLGGEAPRVPGGNLALEVLLGVDVEWVGDLDDDGLDRAVDTVAARLTAEGRRVEVIPLGGSNALGARGYLRCGRELDDQIPGLRHVVVALGTGGTMAGLVAALGPRRVLGVDVGATAKGAERVRRMVEELTAAGSGPGLEASEPLRVLEDQIGAGYGILTQEATGAMIDVARTEGIFLDPVYTAKAMAGLAAAVGAGDIGPDEPTVFVHTGGLPGLFGHASMGDPVGVFTSHGRVD
jgi:D-cysteine desulfhydrase family pyridoxal phosphate-dependent enzyme